MTLTALTPRLLLCVGCVAGLTTVAALQAQTQEKPLTHDRALARTLLANGANTVASGPDAGSEWGAAASSLFRREPQSSGAHAAELRWQLWCSRHERR